VVALEDRCPHRGLPLSFGRLVEDTVVCAYHGFAFRETGECVGVPSQPHVPYGAQVRSFPVVERPPFVWIWPGEPVRSTLAAPPRLRWLEESGWDVFGGSLRVAANYLLLHENALDLTHAPFVHHEQSPAGYRDRPPPMQIEVSERSVSYVREFPPTALVGWQVAATGLTPDQPYAQVETGTFVSPALHVGSFDILLPRDNGPRRYDKVYVRAFTPEGPDSTHIFWKVARNFAIGDSAATDVLRSLHETTLLEDKPILEAIQRRADPGRDEVHVSADVAALRVRHIVSTMLAEERGRAPVRPGFS
jgi:phenylpropionate dioxygenase-like ring-hydroxylating dioxygenase large terminal subunit